jgi:hypothetical protein
LASENSTGKLSQAQTPDEALAKFRNLRIHSTAGIPNTPFENILGKFLFSLSGIGVALAIGV